MIAGLFSNPQVPQPSLPLRHDVTLQTQPINYAERSYVPKILPTFVPSVLRIPGAGQVTPVAHTRSLMTLFETLEGGGFASFFLICEPERATGVVKTQIITYVRASCRSRRPRAVLRSNPVYKHIAVLLQIASLAFLASSRRLCLWSTSPEGCGLPSPELWGYVHR